MLGLVHIVVFAPETPSVVFAQNGMAVFGRAVSLGAVYFDFVASHGAVLLAGEMVASGSGTFVLPLVDNREVVEAVFLSPEEAIRRNPSFRHFV